MNNRYNNTTMGRSSLCSIGTDFNSKHWLSLDICGLICLTFSYTLHLFALFASGFTLIGHHLLAQLLYGEFVLVCVLDDVTIPICYFINIDISYLIYFFAIQ